MNVPDNLWSMLLDLREACTQQHKSARVIAIGADGFDITADAAAVASSNFIAAFHTGAVMVSGWTTIPIIDDRLRMSVAPNSDPKLIRAFRLYVPLCAAKLFFADRPFVLAHMAQTLDGKVATEAGNSKWIGNDANLVHAHRLRALVDGVIVGGVTAQMDLPSLSVRLVSGNHPVRIVLSNSFSDAANLPVVDGMRTILVRATNATDDKDLPVGVTIIRYDGDTQGVDVPGLLTKLCGEGIFSILLEGGPTTLRSFVEASAVDWLQLHIAPLLFGSGKDVVTLPAIQDVDEALRLRNSFYVEMDDGVMITGQA